MPLPHSSLTVLSPVIHGARDYGELARLGLDPEAIIDFSANSNPYGPHPTVLQAVGEAISGPNLARYPDRDCLALRAAIAHAEDVGVDDLLPGNGAAELIQLVALAYVKPGSRHLILGPTFGEYARAIQLAGGEVCEYRSPSTSADLRLAVEEVVSTIQRLQPAGVWLCNPNNPTGQHWSGPELVKLRAADPAGQMLWVIDESYRYFTASPPPLQPANRPAQKKNNPSSGWNSGQNIVILRSLTKDHALAGLRLGYLLAAPVIINTLRAVQPPWSVNTLAQIAGVAAMQTVTLSWRQQSLARLRRHARDLWAGLTALGFKVLPTATSFALIRVAAATSFREELLAHGLLVRDGTSFGLPDYVRIAAQQPAANQRLLAVIQGHARHHGTRLINDR